MPSDAEILANIAAGGNPGDGPLDTFDTPAQLSPEQVQAELSKMREEGGEIEVEVPEPDLEKVSQTEKLDEEKVEDKPKEKPEEEKKEEEDLPEEKEKEAPPALDPNVKVIRAKHGDAALDIPEDATVKVKVKNKDEIVTVKELRDNYSGKQAWTERMQETARKEKFAEQFYEKTKAEKAQVATHLQKIAGLLDSPEADPMDALMYLVDLSGRSVHDYTKRVYESLGKTVLELEGMDPVEREAYWLKRELSYLKNNQAAKESASKAQQTQREQAVRIEKLRESQGVSEEQYVQAHGDLKRLYPDQRITPDAIVKYAAWKPHLDKADEICSAYEEDLSSDQMDQLVEVVAEALKRNPKLTPEKALQIAAHQLDWDVVTEDTLASQIENKAKSAAAARPIAGPPKKTTRNTDRPESFQDFDEEFYGRQRG